MSARLQRLAAALVTAALAGCVLPPKDAPQQTAVADTALGLGESVAPRAADGWWRAYGDPQLDRLIAQAFERNPGLQESIARLRGAKAELDAQRAGLLPSFALDATETRQKFSGRDIIPPPYGGGYWWRGDAMADFSWDLDFWGRQAALIQQAGQLSQAADLQIEASRLMLAGAMAQAYVDLDRSYALADIARRTEAQRQNVLDIARKRVAAGLDTQAEVKQAEGAVPQARVERQQADTAQEIARHQIALLTGHGAEAYAQIERPSVDLAAALPIPDRLPGDLLARRPDVLAARLRIEAADSGRVAAKAAFYPDLELTGFAGWGSIGLADLFNTRSTQFGIGPTLHLPIFEAARLKAAYRGATAQVDEAITAYNDTVLGAVRQVADQLSQLDGLRRELVDQRQALDAAEQAYRIANVRYKAGLANYLVVLNAETQVLAARRGMVDLAAAQAVSRVTLLLALGGSFDPAAPRAAAGTSPSPSVSASRSMP